MLIFLLLHFFVIFYGIYFSNSWFVKNYFFCLRLTRLGSDSIGSFQFSFLCTNVICNVLRDFFLFINDRAPKSPLNYVSIFMIFYSYLTRWSLPTHLESLVWRCLSNFLDQTHFSLYNIRPQLRTKNFWVTLTIYVLDSKILNSTRWHWALEIKIIQAITQIRFSMNWLFFQNI